MTTGRLRHLPAVALALLLIPAAARAQDVPIVEIGRAGGSGAGLALGPAGWRNFTAGGIHVQGQSDPAKDWPYVHPGPDDNWAGRRTHAFRILFGLAADPSKGDGELVLECLDAHRSAPPQIEIAVNGEVVARATLPAGGGDESIRGDLARVKRHTLRVPVPAARFRPGTNTVSITSRKGSWFLYEHLVIRLPGARSVPVAAGTRLLDGEAFPAAIERDGRLLQPVVLHVLRVGGPGRTSVRLDGADAVVFDVEPGLQDLELLVPAGSAARRAAVEIDGERHDVSLRAVPRLTIYVVPHSHTDIGYTHLQPEVEQRQIENVSKGMALAARTAAYPEGARFVWNIEVLWAADLFLQRMDVARRDAFEKAVKAGQVALNGLYLNILSGLSRPEELVQATRLATRLAERLGVPIDSAMISDIPGHTWGLVPVLAQAGIRYLSTSPNFFDRIGTAQVASADQPFWWVGPSGRERVLTWNTWMGYALSHTWNARLTPAHVAQFLDHLEEIRYPYDLTYIRWSGLGDNAEPEPTVADAVKEWNARYRWPRFVISDQRTPFVELEKRYGDRLPVRRGDWTPYWEDGAGSSARETAMNRASADRLTQAETLWALRAPEAWQAAAADAAWKKVLLYTEHTWGAWNSISQPEEEFVRAQWDIKRGYAEEADWLSRSLLDRAGPPTVPSSTFEVVNTASWQRTDIVRVPAGLSIGGDRVVDASGAAVPSQRLTTGELAVLVEGIPPFAARRYRVASGRAAAPNGTHARVSGTSLDNGFLSLRLDPATGSVVGLDAKSVSGNLVDTSSGRALNQYLFMTGSDAERAAGSGRTRIVVKEPGPLVASLVAESEAPGARSLLREVRVVAGVDRAEFATTIDKARAPAGSKGDFYGAASKESISLAFPFAVPGGQVRLELPLAGVIRPNADQIAGSCKNWFTVGNWADVAAPGRGVTWVSLDTPLVQVGGLTANLLNSQTDPAVWRTSVEPTQALYPWLMNNHWGTNYRAYQEGPVTFRFAVRAHRGFDAAAAMRLATGLAQPLLAVAAGAAPPTGRSRLRLDNDQVIVASFKPSDDGRGWILRLYNASDAEQQVNVEWDDPRPRRMALSATSEAPLAELSGPITIAPWGLVTVRAER